MGLAGAARHGYDADEPPRRGSAPGEAGVNSPA